MSWWKYLVCSMLIVCVTAVDSFENKLNFDVSVHDAPLSVSKNMKMVTLCCGVHPDELANIRDDRKTALNTDQHSLVLNDNSGLYIKYNGSVIDTSYPYLTDYTMAVLENGNLTAKFYILESQEFIAKFTCGYNSSGLTNITQSDLVLVYIPIPLLLKESFIFWLILFSLLFIVVLGLFCVVVACRLCCFTNSNMTHSGDNQFTHEKSNHYIEIKNRLLQAPKSPLLFTASGYAVHSCTSSSITTDHDLPLKYCDAEKNASSVLERLVSRSETNFISEETANELIRYLTHPSPCQIISCPCSYYKQKLKGSRDTALKDPSNNTPHTAMNRCSGKGGSEKEVQVLKREAIYSASTPSSEDLTKGCSNSIFYSSIVPSLTDVPNEFDMKINYIDPVEIITFGNKGGSYANEDHNIYLKVPEGAIPEGMTISIEVGVSLYSPLTSLLPHGTIPISPLVKLCVVGKSNFKFLKPVEVILPHFLDISVSDDAKKMELQFVKVRHNLYCFHQSDGIATFTPQSFTATLKTDHFCSFCIIAKETIPVDKINYRLVKVVPKNRQSNTWKASFCVTYLLRTCLQALKKQFLESEYEIKTLTQFKLAESSQIEIQFERKLAGGWQLTLEYNKKIGAEDVEYWKIDPEELEIMEEERVYPPRFEVQVCGSQAKETTIAYIYFKGLTKSGSDMTELLLEPVLPANGRVMKLPYHMLHPSTSMPVICDQRHNPAIKMSGGGLQRRPLSGALLDSPLLGDLMNHVAAALPTKWKMVGVQLGLSLAKLDEIEASNFGNCKCCFSSVFSEWEKLNTTPYSWSTIIDVLQTPCVEENRVAEDLRSYLVDDYDNISLLSKGSSTSGSIVSRGYFTDSENNLSSNEQMI